MFDDGGELHPHPITEWSDSAELVQRTVAAIVEAHVAGWSAEQYRRQSVNMRDRSLELRKDSTVVWKRLHEYTDSFARGKRAAGAPPEQMVIELKKIVERVPAALDVKCEIERDVVRWGIEAYYAA